MIAIKIISMLVAGYVVIYPFYLLNEKINAKIEKYNQRKNILKPHEL